MWVTKLLIFPVEIRIFCPKTTKFGPKLAFLVNLGQAMQAYSMPCCGSVGGCGARAASRKTPIYFILVFQKYWLVFIMRDIFQVGSKNHERRGPADKLANIVKKCSPSTTFDGIRAQTSSKSCATNLNQLVFISISPYHYHDGLKIASGPVVVTNFCGQLLRKIIRIFCKSCSKTFANSLLKFGKKC